jgi:hypothetical protein
MPQTDRAIDIGTREALRLKLKEINLILREKSVVEENLGVLEGRSGIALFQFYYAKYIDNDKFADWGHDTLINIMNVVNQGYGMPNLIIFMDVA